MAKFHVEPECTRQAIIALNRIGIASTITTLPDVSVLEVGNDCAADASIALQDYIRPAWYVRLWRMLQP